MSDAYTIPDGQGSQAPDQMAGQAPEDTKSQDGQAPKPADGECLVRLSSDKMEAYLQVIPPQGGSPVTVEKAMEALKAAGVVHGVDPQAVAWAVEAAARAGAGEAPLPDAFLVARGTPPVHGTDGRVEYAIDFLSGRGVPGLTEDDRADFFNLNLVCNVEKGQLLATRIPAIKGIPGRTVTDQALPARDGKEAPFRAGKGAVVDESGVRIVADINGHVTLIQGLISVLPVYEVKGDVGPATGNINFVGTVVVRGSVLSGFCVRAEQDVEIHGSVDGGVVEAGGNVTVRYGVQGGGKGGIKAGGNVVAKFIENAWVHAGGDIGVAQGILHSQLKSGRKVQASGRRGSIIGGSVRAKEEVIARVLGSPFATPTEIEVGASPDLREELDAIRKSLLEAEDNLKKAEQAIKLLKEAEAQAGTLPPARKEMLLKAVRTQYHLTAQRENLLARKSEKEGELAQAIKGKVRVEGSALPGVRIIIGPETYTVSDVIYKTVFYVNDRREITFGNL